MEEYIYEGLRYYDTGEGVYKIYKNGVWKKELETGKDTEVKMYKELRIWDK